MKVPYNTPANGRVTLLIIMSWRSIPTEEGGFAICLFPMQTFNMRLTRIQVTTGFRREEPVLSL